MFRAGPQSFLIWKMYWHRHESNRTFWYRWYRWYRSISTGTIGTTGTIWFVESDLVPVDTDRYHWRYQKNSIDIIQLSRFGTVVPMVPAKYIHICAGVIGMGSEYVHLKCMTNTDPNSHVAYINTGTIGTTVPVVVIN